jgi:hypothetical protein
VKNKILKKVNKNEEGESNNMENKKLWEESVKAS